MKAKKLPELYLVDVQPLVRGLREPSMTYFSSDQYRPGSVVTVPFRSKEREAVVLSAEPVTNVKAEIKSSGFSLKKIAGQAERSLFSPTLLAVANDLASYYATSVGEVLSALSPSSVLESGLSFQIDTTEQNKRKRDSSPIYVQAVKSERVAQYHKLIERSLANDQSVLLLSPTVESARSLRDELKTASLPVEVFLLSSALNKKEQIETWRAAVENQEPAVVVVTPGFMSVPIKNIGLCIVNEVGSEQYVGIKKPYLDARVAMKKISQSYGAKLVLGDILIPISELKDASEGLLGELGEVQIKVVPQLHDMTEGSKDEDRSADVKAPTKKKVFKLISDELLELTAKFLAEQKKVFWFVARRGLFPSTVCRDCGTEHRCEKCGSALVLHEINKKRIFLCHRCEHKEDTLVTCKVCGSWRLEPLGVGIDRAYEEACKRFGDPILVSADATGTKTQVKNAVRRFYELGGLLIGTDLALPYLEKGVDQVGIVTIDSRLALPLYNAEESALRTLLELNSLARESAFVQTRQPDNRVFVSMGGRKLRKFRNEESLLREAFQYPPFGLLISITINKDKSVAEAEREKIADFLRPLLEEKERLLLPTLRGTKKRGVYSATIILKIRDSLESNSLLRDGLRSLPSNIDIRVGPENLW